jgi:phospholipase C
MPVVTEKVTRRTFVGTGAMALGAAAVGRPVWAAAGRTERRRHQFDHVVVVMMENRSFDHFLGWMKGADGRQAGLTYTDRAGVAHETHPLAPDWQGCGKEDPDHSYLGGRAEYNGGRCDGWLRAGRNDDYAIGYYERKDLKFLGRAVPRWTTFSRYFAPIMSSTFPNRFYQHAAQTDRMRNTFGASTLPTIWDRLADAGLKGRYYYSDVPFVALWGAKYLNRSHNVLQFFADCADGKLGHVSFVDPAFAGEAEGTSRDDHPHADIRSGQAFMEQIYRAVTHSPQWERTVLVFNYDEWGGFFDHVRPSRAPIPPASRFAGDVDGLLGFRVPCLLVSPHARREHVSHKLYDHTSILRMIERRWSLKPLTVRDARAHDLGQELTGPRRLRAPQFQVPKGPFGGACPAVPAPESPPPPVARAASTRRSKRSEWLDLLEVAAAHGWPV